MIAICLPSRGLMHSRTMQDILANVGDKREVGFYFSHGNPIPDAHNIVVEEALLDKPDFIWMCEDDMAYEHDTLNKLLKADVDLAVCDYPVGPSKGDCLRYWPDGELKYGGLGCLLVKPIVFKKIGKPYFRTSVIYHNDEMEELQIDDKAQIGMHGAQDVDFWKRALGAGCSYSVVGRVGHYELVEPKLPKYGNQTALQYKVGKWE